MDTGKKWMPAMLLLTVLVATGACADSPDTPVFLETRIRLGDNELVVELADTPEKRATGLMFRKSLASNAGMLFIYNHERIITMWMKNTFIPLSVGFFDEDLELVDIQDMQPARSVMQTRHRQYNSRVPARYALEMNIGWFVANNIVKGAQLKFLDQEAAVLDKAVSQ